MRPHSRLTSRQSKSFAKRRTYRSVLIAGLVIVSASTWIFSFVRFSQLQALSISSVRVYGADADIVGSLQASAYGAIQGDYLGLFSKSNTLFYPADSIKTAVALASPRVGSVEVKRDGVRALAVTVSQKVPAAIICSGLPDFTGNILSSDVSDSCYFADSTGYIFERAPAIRGYVYHRYYMPDLGEAASTTDALIGARATTTSAFALLEKAYNAASAASIQPEAMLVKSGGEYELYARNPTAPAVASTTASAAGDADTVVVYLNESRPLLSQISDLALFWSNMNQSYRRKGQKILFDYIDVRFGPNVFYRTIQ